MKKLPLNIAKWFMSLDKNIRDLYEDNFKYAANSQVEMLLCDLLETNFTLWGFEDQARRKDVPDKIIANIKRNIDKFNQKRHDIVNTIDALLRKDIENKINTATKYPVLNSEAPGSIFDRLIVLALRAYHLKKEMSRKDAYRPHKHKCANMLKEVKERSGDLLKCLKDLMDDYYAGRKILKSYREHKLYNDPDLNPALRKKP